LFFEISQEDRQELFDMVAEQDRQASLLPGQRTEVVHNDQPLPRQKADRHTRLPWRSGVLGKAR
jgi:hypothetical protein